MLNHIVCNFHSECKIANLVGNCFAKIQNLAFGVASLDFITGFDVRCNVVSHTVLSLHCT